MPDYSVRAAVVSSGSPPPVSSASFSFTDSDAFIYTDSGPPFQFDLAEITAVEPGDETLKITVVSGEQVVLSGLGNMQDEIVSGFNAARLDRTSFCFRFGRPIGDGWERGEAIFPGASAPVPVSLRLFFALLGVIPQSGEPVAVPYADIRQIAFDEPAYQIVITMVDSTALKFGKFGKRTTPFLEGLRRASADFSVAYQTQLKNIAPDLPPPVLRALSEDWREGIALPAARLDQVSPGFSTRLLEFLPLEDRRPFVAALRGLSAPPAIGFYFSPDAAASESDAPPFIPFTLFPLKDGAALAWETLGENALATYVFRGGDASALTTVNAALRAIRFAREPVYLSEAEMKTKAEYRQYVPLLLRASNLRILKQQFAGRALHTDPETYTAALKGLAAG